MVELAIMLAICLMGVTFMTTFFIALCRELQPKEKCRATEIGAVEQRDHRYLRSNALQWKKTSVKREGARKWAG